MGALNALLVMVLAGAPTPVPVVSLGDVQPPARDLAAELLGPGYRAMSPADVLQRLAGVDDARPPDEAAVATLLVDAENREANFDAAGARALRQKVLQVFDATPRPSERLRLLAAQALHGQAAAELSATGRRQEALRIAREAATRFADTRVDTKRYNPEVLALFDEARAQVQSAPKAVLQVTSPLSAAVWVDGMLIGRGVEASRSLPLSAYRVWLVSDSGVWSLPHRVTVFPTGSRLTIDPAFEWRLQLHPTVALQCASTCAEDLAELGRRVGAGRVIGVSAGQALVVEVGQADQAVVSKTVQLGAEPPAAAHRAPPLEHTLPTVSSRRRFDPLYLIPFGVGQVMQDRPVFGIAYGATEAGLAVWHTVALARHRQALNRGDYGQETDLRKTRNLSGELLVGAVIAGVAEAVLVGWFTGSD